MALGGIGAVIILLVWGIIATLPKKEDGREGEVRLRSEIKDNFTLKDMLRSVEKEMENRRETPMPGGGNYGMDEPEDTVSPESEIQRIRELIRASSQPNRQEMDSTSKGMNRMVRISKIVPSTVA